MYFQKKYLCADEAAEYLGISLRTLYSYVSQKMIAVYKPARKLYISIEELDRFIESGKQSGRKRYKKTKLLRDRE